MAIQTASNTADAQGNYGISIPLNHRIDGVVLRKTLPGTDTKIRPTNTTAVLHIGTNINDTVEVILLQNGPKGGFSQLGSMHVDSTITFASVNGVIEALITTLDTPA